jgi:hypothetical protein
MIYDVTAIGRWDRLSKTSPGIALEAGMTVGIVQAALLGVTKHRIGFLWLRHPFCRSVVIRVPVGVVLHGQAAYVFLTATSSAVPVCQ